jgi:hypothetical protein
MSERTEGESACSRHQTPQPDCRRCRLEPSGTTGPADATVEGIIERAEHLADTWARGRYGDKTLRLRAELTAQTLRDLVAVVAGPADAGSHDLEVAESGSQGERSCLQTLGTLPDSAISELHRAYERIHELEQRLGLDERRILAASASAPAVPRETQTKENS